ncbi:MAG: alpha/beta hydrolase [Myxococcales bacterium]|nr:alpha/beta hydrolase [Myxococcales bacterium]MDH3484355.1 alpha/beta hydrolase [Myxococcales bacterium]
MRAASRSLVIVAVLLSGPGDASAERVFKEVDFPTAGGIQAHADLYAPKGKASTLILLFHQAGWSRGEYREIAPKLVARGYQVLAVDQRSGNAVNGVPNETHRRAAKKNAGTNYLDAYADLQAALKYATERLKAGRVIAWGSSYSASLVFRLAAEHPDEVVALLAFSPGEYFQKTHGKKYIQSFAGSVKHPVFVTSAKAEREKAKLIFEAVPAEKKILFTPASLGQHGSRALWAKWKDNDVYWAAVNAFLREYAPPNPPN